MEDSSTEFLNSSIDFYDNLVEALLLTDSRNFEIAKENFERYIAAKNSDLYQAQIQIGKKLILCYNYRLSYDYETLEKISQECILESQKIKDNILLSLSIGENLWYQIIQNKLDQVKNQLVDVLSKLQGSANHILYTRWKIVNLIGEVLTNSGYQKECLEYMYELVDISRRYGNPEYISRSLNNLAITYEYSGNFSKANEAYTESIKICRDINDHLGEAFTRGNMGFINMYQGQWDQALYKFTKTKNYFLARQDIRETLYWQNNIAKLYLEKGEYWSAKTLLEENIAMMRFYNLQDTLVYPYFDYFLVSVQLEFEDDMNESFEIMREIAANNPDNKLFEHYTLLCSAILLRKSNNLHINFITQVLDFLITEDVVDVEVAILAAINRCELYLEELHKSEEENDEIVMKILQLISFLEDLSLNNQMYPLLILSKILASQFLAITGQFQESLDVLNSAISISVDNGLNGLLNEAFKQKEEVEKELLNIYDRIISQSSVKDRLQELDFETYLERIKNYRLFR